MQAVLRAMGRRWVMVLLIALGVIWLVPDLYMISISLRTPVNAFDPHLLAFPMTLANYWIVITQNPLLHFFVNSLIVTGGTVVLVIVVASLCAFGISILHLRGSQTLFALLLVTLMVPLSALVVPVAVLLGRFGWINSYQGLIGPYTALGIPFALVLFKAFLDDFPADIHEAALLDGCTTWQLYWYVVLPLLRPIIGFVGIWQFVTSWNEFFLALVVMTQNSMKTLPLVPMEYSGMYMANPGALFAILCIIALPLIVLYILVQRMFVRGLLEGSVKG